MGGCWILQGILARVCLFGWGAGDTPYPPHPEEARPC